MLTRIRWLHWLITVLIASWVCIPQAIQAAAAIHLEMPPLKGESVAEGHVDDIAILSFQFSVRAEPTPTGGATTRTAPVFSGLTLVKNLDRTSPRLAIDLAKGTTFPKATLALSALPSGGAKPTDYYLIELEQVTVVSLSMAGAGGAGVPTESVDLVFQKITWIYRRFDEKGAVREEIKETYDLVKEP